MAYGNGFGAQDWQSWSLLKYCHFWFLVMLRSWCYNTSAFFAVWTPSVVFPSAVINFHLQSSVQAHNGTALAQASYLILLYRYSIFLSARGETISYGAH